MGGPTSPVRWDAFVVGDTLYWNGTGFVRLADVAAGKYLRSGGVATAPAWGTIAYSEISGTPTIPTLLSQLGGTLAIGAGGTGQVTAASAFDALSPLTTQGDLIFRNATTNTRLGTGTAGQLLTSGGAGANPSWTTVSGGVTAHSALTGLTSGDDHTQYALLAGRSGGQTLIGGTASGNNLTLQSTSHATKGRILSDSITVQPLQTGVVGFQARAFSGDGSTPIAYFLNGGGSAMVTVSITGAVGAANFGAVAGGVSFTPGTGAPGINTGFGLMVGTPWTGGGCTITATQATYVGLTVQLAAAQSASSIEIISSAAAVLSSVDGAGRFLAPLGALATVGYGFLGDPNTGLYSTGADVMSLVSGGTDRMKVNATGIGFFAATPVAQPAGVADATGGATIDAEARTAINAVITKLESLGLLATV